MNEERRFVDLSGLPTVVFGPKSLPWWGTIGFIVIEAFTLLLMVASYFYVRLNSYAWPPEGTPLPDVVIPTVNVLVLLAVIYPMWKASHAASRFERAETARWLVIATALTAVTVALRGMELLALNVRWDENAYASVAWGVVVLHATLIVVDLFETGALAAMFLFGHAEKKHYPDVSDAADYQYYLSTVWVPLYLVVYWSPRIL
jgi:cytochrome c oxidase subunit III